MVDPAGRRLSQAEGPGGECPQERRLAVVEQRTPGADAAAALFHSRTSRREFLDPAAGSSGASKGARCWSAGRTRSRRAACR